MRYFLDTEFMEKGATHPIYLISIGIVDENGGEYYAENAEFEKAFATPWLRQNVIPHLRGPPKTRVEIKKDILNLIPPDSQPEFWGYFADYDWVVFAQLFGSMVDLPKGYPFYCRDLKQFADSLGVKKEKYPEQKGTEHNALEDARWNRDLFKFLMQKR